MTMDVHVHPSTRAEGGVELCDKVAVNLTAA
jgi:hypothetical protein